MRFILFLLLLSTIPPLVLHAQLPSHSSTASCEGIYDSTFKRSYHIVVEKMPAYKGGLEKLMKVISKNVKYPGPWCCIEGPIFLSFIVEPDGALTNKKVVIGFGDGTDCDFNKEALRVLDFLTDWIPGQCNGKNVAVKMVLPIRIHLATE